MKFLILACLLIPSSHAAAQNAEELYNRASVNSLKSYGKDGSAAAADAAIAELDAAIKLRPSYHDAYNLRASMKLGKGDLDGALADYSKAISLAASTSASYRANRARLLEKKGDVKGALADMTAAIELRPDDGRAYMDRGEIRFTAKDYAGAAADFTKGIELKPDLFVLRQKRAAAYRALGKKELADADEKRFKEEQKKFFEKLGR